MFTPGSILVPVCVCVSRNRSPFKGARSRMCAACIGTCRNRHVDGLFSMCRIICTCRRTRRTADNSCRRRRGQISRQRRRRRRAKLKPCLRRFFFFVLLLVKVDNFLSRNHWSNKGFQETFISGRGTLYTYPWAKSMKTPFKPLH